MLSYPMARIAEHLGIPVHAQSSDDAVADKTIEQLSSYKTQIASMKSSMNAMQLSQGDSRLDPEMNVLMKNVLARRNAMGS